MRIIVPPEQLLSTSEYPRALFLAGGITGCPDWQEEVLRTNFHGWNVLNPRRPNFDVSNPAMSDEQVDWEYDHLELADVILFWFAEKQIQPIALYELGSWARSTKPIAVGCHPDYPRRWDVMKQLSRRRPGLPIHNNLPNLIRNTQDLMKTFGR